MKTITIRMLAVATLVLTLAEGRASAFWGIDQIWYPNQDSVPVLLVPGQGLLASKGYYRLVMQDGKLRVFGGGPAGTEYVWESPNSVPGAYAIFRDGNLLIYDRDGHVVWSNGAQGYGTLIMQNDGNVVYYLSSGQVAWASYGNYSSVELSAPFSSDDYLTQTRLYGNSYFPEASYLGDVELDETDPMLGITKCATICSHLWWAGCRGYTLTLPTTQKPRALCALITNQGRVTSSADTSPGVESGLLPDW